MCQLKDLGLISYEEAYNLQRHYVDGRLKGGAQTLLLCEHPTTLTLGRLANEKHLLVEKDELVSRRINVFSIDRGGDITLHAPGQLVIYPILDLKNHGKDLRSYLRQLEQVAIDFLEGFGIVASRFPRQTGVWVGKKKIVSIGIGVRKWISFHGLAVNVSTDLKLFSMIKPCGLDVEMTSISEIKEAVISVSDVKSSLVKNFQKNFQIQLKGE